MKASFTQTKQIKAKILELLRGEKNPEKVKDFEIVSKLYDIYYTQLGLRVEWKENLRKFTNAIRHENNIPSFRKESKLKEEKPKNIVVNGEEESFEIPFSDYTRSQRESAKIKKSYSDLNTQNKLLLKELDAEITKNNILLGVPSGKSNCIKIVSTDKGTKSEATALIVGTDWHSEEKVESHSVNGLNEFNQDILERRSKNFFANAMILIKKERQNVRISNVILALLGDLINGNIHLEFIEENFFSPTQAILKMRDILISGIDYILEDKEIKKLFIPCSYGNHGRDTIKPMVSSAYKHSYEWLLYNILAKHYEGNSRIEFQIANQYFNYVKVYDKVIRFHHGDNIKYGGGVGGVAIPLIKYIHKSNMQIKADLDVLGHFHISEFNRNAKYMICGSLVGYNAYAIKIGAGFEPPVQHFLLIDSKRGFTVSAPIILE